MSVFMSDVTDKQKRAWRDLLDAPRAGERPCMRDPKWWDIDPPNSEPNPTSMAWRAYRLGVKERQLICIEKCPVLGQCMVFASTNPPVHGVLAATTEEERANMGKRGAA